jgi:hypothetical protein
MTYQIVDGYNNEATLAAVTVQPLSQGIIAGRFSIAGDGSKVHDGFPSTVWEYTALTDTQFAALNTQFGVSRDTPSNQVTIQTNPHEDADTWQVFNGIIDYPNVTREGNYRNGFWHDVEYQIRRLTTPSEESS